MQKKFNSTLFIIRLLVQNIKPQIHGVYNLYVNISAAVSVSDLNDDLSVNSGGEMR